MDEKEIINPELEDNEEENIENSLRPKTLKEYIGQTKVKKSLIGLIKR